jgi:hypothetical protein
MKRKVYIPNLPTRYDAATERRVPTLDLNPAAQYGDLEILSEGPIHKDSIQDTIELIGIELCKMDPQDLILCVGDFVLAAASIAYACDRNGAVNVLRWNKNKRAYDVMEVQL